MREQSSTSNRDAEPNRSGRAQFSERPSELRGYWQLQQAALSSSTHQQRCRLVRWYERRGMCGLYSHRSYCGPERCCPMRAGIFWNSHSPCGNRRDYINAGYRFPTQDFRCRAIDLSVTRLRKNSGLGPQRLKPFASKGSVYRSAESAAPPQSAAPPKIRCVIQSLKHSALRT